MKHLTLNLLHPDRSDITYRTMTFNDGEPHIWLENIDRKADVTVRCRVSSPDDLFLLMQVGDILRRQAVRFTLDITYLMSMRMDRVISFGESFSLKVVADCINSLGAYAVRLLEPHSDRATQEIRHSQAVGGISLKPGLVYDTDIIVHPDAGAADRYQPGAWPRIVASKQRDTATGRILSLQLQDGADDVVRLAVELHPQAQLLVVDDLCDGGGTFVRLAQLLGARYPDRQRRIFVTHMVNADGIAALADNYNQVTFTNSFCDWRHAANITLPKNVSVVDIDREWNV